MTVNTRVIKLFLRQQQDMLSVPLAGGLRLQLLPNVSYLPRCQKHQFAAFIQDSSMLLVWDDEPKHLLDRANNIEDQLMSIIWRGEGEYGDGTTVTTSKAPSVKLNEAHGNGAMNEAAAEPPRKTMLIQPILAAFTLILIFAAIGSGWREIAIELVVDKSWLRLAFLAVVPIQIWLALVRDRFLLLSYTANTRSSSVNRSRVVQHSCLARLVKCMTIQNSTLVDLRFELVTVFFHMSPSSVLFTRKASTRSLILQ